MAATAPARARARPATSAPPQRHDEGERAASRRRAVVAARPRVAGGVIWIAVVAVLLVGIVALNVAALRLSLDAQRLEERKDELVAENAETASRISSLASAERIEEVARGQLGLVDATDPRYLRVRSEP
jgi:cell division protein FtsL